MREQRLSTFHSKAALNQSLTGLVHTYSANPSRDNTY